MDTLTFQQEQLLDVVVASEAYAHLNSAGLVQVPQLKEPTVSTLVYLYRKMGGPKLIFAILDMMTADHDFRVRNQKPVEDQEKRFKETMLALRTTTTRIDDPPNVSVEKLDYRETDG